MANIGRAWYLLRSEGGSQGNPQKRRIMPDDSRPTDMDQFIAKEDLSQDDPKRDSKEGPGLSTTSRSDTISSEDLTYKDLRQWLEEEKPVEKEAGLFDFLDTRKIGPTIPNQPKELLEETEFHDDIPSNSPVKPSAPTSGMASGMAPLMASGVAPRMASAPSPGAHFFVPPPHSQLSIYLPSIVTLLKRFEDELKDSRAQILNLNPSRRMRLLLYFHQNSGIPVYDRHIQNPRDSLRVWLDPLSSERYTKIFRSYCMDLGLSFIAQCLLLKSWNDKGLRKWSEEDLARMNFVISRELKAHTPIGGKTWYVTSQNLYSWYRPSSELQKEIWNAISHWDLGEEDGEFLRELFISSHRHSEVPFDQKNYDPRFFSSIWNFSRENFLGELGKRRPMGEGKTYKVFSPSLGNGGFASQLGSNTEVYGSEISPIHLICAELCSIWKGPKRPQPWLEGSGIGLMSTGQLTLDWAKARRSPSLELGSMVDFDKAVVIEDHTIHMKRSFSYWPLARQEISTSEELKELNLDHITLGSLQAIVSASKLRPGGLLWWFRNQAITQADVPVMKKILNKSKLLCQWDFSELDHSMPSTQALYPKYLYLFQAEPSQNDRDGHTPSEISVKGSLRSHVEIPLLIADALETLLETKSNRYEWKICKRVSPVPQSEWMESWPDDEIRNQIEKMERLKSASKPLGEVASVKALGKKSKKQESQIEDGILQSVDGADERDEFYLCEKSVDDEIAFSVHSTPPEFKTRRTFVVNCPNQMVKTSLMSYLESDAVTSWLKLYCSQSGKANSLDEKKIRYIPVPDAVTHINPEMVELVNRRFENFSHSLDQNPESAHQSINKIRSSSEWKDIRPAFFHFASIKREEARKNIERVSEIVDEKSSINWTRLMGILPQKESTNFQLHSAIKCIGNLPPHVPVTKIDLIRQPVPKIFFAIEAGLHLIVSSDDLHLIEILWSQVKDRNSPTWSELISTVRLPRSSAFARAAAEDLVSSRARVETRIESLQKILFDCLDY